MRDDSPWDKEGFRLKNIRFHQTVSRKKAFILVTLTVLDFDVHLNMKYKIFSKQNFSLQCPGTITCLVEKPLEFITPIRYIPYTFFCLINLILARPSLLSSILLDASNPITKFSPEPEISFKYLLWWLMPSVAIIKTLGSWIMARRQD